MSGKRSGSGSLNTEQKEEDDGEADDGEADDDDQAAAVIGIGSLGQLALFWPSWCSFVIGFPCGHSF